jgi:hypothetical protein
MATGCVIGPSGYTNRAYEMTPLSTKDFGGDEKNGQRICFPILMHGEESDGKKWIPTLVSSRRRVLHQTRPFQVERHGLYGISSVMIG